MFITISDSTIKKLVCHMILLAGVFSGSTRVSEKNNIGQLTADYVGSIKVEIGACLANGHALPEASWNIEPDCGQQAASRGKTFG